MFPSLFGLLVFFFIKYTRGQKIMNVEIGQFKKAEWKPL